MVVEQSVVDLQSAVNGVRFTARIFEHAYATLPSVVCRAPTALVLLRSPERALAVALPWGVLVAVSEHPRGQAEFYSRNHYTDRFTIDPIMLGETTVPPWAEHSAHALANRALPRGIRLLTQQELPAEMDLLTGVETFCATSLAVQGLYDAHTTVSPPPTDDEGDWPLASDLTYVVVLCARERHALLVGGGGVEHIPCDLAATGHRLLLMELGLSQTVPSGGRVHEEVMERAAHAVRAGDMTVLGALLTEAHVPGVDVMELALDAASEAGALGGRAVGRCAVVLVPTATVPRVRAVVMAKLAGVARRPPRFLTVTPAAGTRRVG
ncbi:hypothetical protein GCM10012275_59370 [Longimycelium tulufanense]|uniref:Uncharacterized protein n=1 Tax=Longimycelium tulufanense TaxID=907463 RepID=A0A8J3FXM2_9PSEU|nr:hypothetical protein [Longimycelium tulufanense]GGM80872.1 hypothetical protein GCM10012275_59370 [Longimycelium tulufanense]